MKFSYIVSFVLIICLPSLANAQKLKRSHLYVVKGSEIRKIKQNRIKGLITIKDEMLTGRVRLVDGKYLLNNQYYQQESVRGILYHNPQPGRGILKGVGFVGKGVAALGAMMLRGDDEDNTDLNQTAAGAALAGTGELVSLSGGHFLPPKNVTILIDPEVELILSLKPLNRQNVIDVTRRRM